MLEKMKSAIKNKLGLRFNNDFSNATRVLWSFIGFAVIISLAVTAAGFSMRKTLTVSIDGKSKKIVTYKSNEKEALENSNILVGPKDKVQPSLDTNVKDGDKITIKKAVNVDVAVDGKVLKIKSAEKNVQNMLKAEHITLSKIDKIKPAKNSLLRKGLKIFITRVDSQIVKNNEEVGFATEVMTDNTMGNDEKQIIQQGQAGQKEVLTKFVYEDGVQVSKNTLSENVVKQPVKQIVKIGTLGVLKPDRGGRVLYEKSIDVDATAYTNDFGFGITASGSRVKRDANGYSSIAVDPSVIPLGSKLYIPGYGYGVAEDTGGAIKGNRLDLFFSSEKDCYSWGVRNIKVYILKN